MVALLVRLRLTVLRQTYRRSTAAAIGTTLGVIFAGGITLATLITLVQLRGRDSDVAADLTVAGFGLATLGWLLSPLLFFGVDQTLDTRHFALLPVRARRLAPGLLVGALVSVPSAAFTLCALGLLMTWSRSPAAFLAAAMAAPLGVVTALLLVRLAGTAFGAVLAARRTREVMAVVLALFGSSFGVGANVLSRVAADHPDQVRQLLGRVADGVALTPLGWAWAVPADVARGHHVAAAVRLLLAAVLAATLYAVWVRLLERTLSSPFGRIASAGSARAHRRVDRLLGTSPAAAVAGRSLRYWRRDSRMLSQLTSLFVVPLIVVVTPFVVGEEARVILLLAPPMVALLAGNLVANSLSLDGPSLWTDLVTGIPGRQDRLGRLIAFGLVLGPVVVLLLLGATVLSGRPDLAVPTAAITLTAFTVSAGVASAVGTVFQTPLPPPGANPYQQRSGSGLEGVLSLMVTQTITTLVCLPVVLLALLGSPGPVRITMACVLAVLLGALSLVGGTVWGGRRLDRRGAHILARMRRHG